MGVFMGIILIDLCYSLFRFVDPLYKPYEPFFPLLQHIVFFYNAQMT